MRVIVLLFTNSGRQIMLLHLPFLPFLLPFLLFFHYLNCGTGDLIQSFHRITSQVPHPTPFYISFLDSVAKFPKLIFNFQSFCLCLLENAYIFLNSQNAVVVFKFRKLRYMEYWFGTQKLVFVSLVMSKYFQKSNS